MRHEKTTITDTHTHTKKNTWGVKHMKIYLIFDPGTIYAYGDGVEYWRAYEKAYHPREFNFGQVSMKLQCREVIERIWKTIFRIRV